LQALVKEACRDISVLLAVVAWLVAEAFIENHFPSWSLHNFPALLISVDKKLDQSPRHFSIFSWTYQ